MSISLYRKYFFNIKSFATSKIHKERGGSEYGSVIADVDALELAPYWFIVIEYIHGCPHGLLNILLFCHYRKLLIFYNYWL